MDECKIDGALKIWRKNRTDKIIGDEKTDSTATVQQRVPHDEKRIQRTRYPILSLQVTDNPDLFQCLYTGHFCRSNLELYSVFFSPGVKRRSQLKCNWDITFTDLFQNLRDSCLFQGSYTYFWRKNRTFILKGKPNSDEYAGLTKKPNKNTWRR